MGLFDKLFGKKPQQPPTVSYYQTLNAYTPTFANRAGQIYESELIRAAIDARARHISKLSVQFEGSALPTLRSLVKSSPNDWQTWGQFLYRVSTILDNANTAFIAPVWDEDARIAGYYPLNPLSTQIVESDGVPYLVFQFASGKRASRPLAECGILTKFQYKDDFFGETNDALSPTLSLINMQRKGIEEGIKNSAAVRFMAKYTAPAFDDDLSKEQDRFTRTVIGRSKSGGVLLFPNTYSDIRQVENKQFVADPDQMQRIETNVYNYFGVNADILQNKAIGNTWDAFYEGAIEPFAIQLSDVLTKMTYTRREHASGNRISCTANRLQYMSNADKLAMITQMRDRGIFNGDECREILNLPPLPDGIGQKYVILSEFVDHGAANGGENNAENE